MKIVLCNSFNGFWLSVEQINKLYDTKALKNGEWYGNINRTNPTLVKIAEKEDLGNTRVEEIPAGLKYKVVTVCDGREEIKIL